jgi:hypothetical protein
VGDLTRIGDDAGDSEALKILFTTLEGLVNRTKPRIYFKDSSVDDQEGADFWLGQFNSKSHIRKKMACPRECPRSPSRPSARSRIRFATRPWTKHSQRGYPGGVTGPDAGVAGPGGGCAPARFRAES